MGERCLGSGDTAFSTDKYKCKSIKKVSVDDITELSFHFISICSDDDYDDAENDDDDGKDDIR